MSFIPPLQIPAFQPVETRRQLQSWLHCRLGCETSGGLPALVGLHGAGAVAPFSDCAPVDLKWNHNGIKPGNQWNPWKSQF